MSALKGRIIHRLELNECSSDISTSRKRRRSSNEREQIQDGDVKQQLSVPGEESSLVPPWSSSGLVFIPSDTFDSPYKEFVLSLPQVLLKKACDAALFQQEVVIRRYSIFPLSLSSNQQERTPFALLEVHNDGMKIKKINSLDHREIDSNSLWTLSQFRRRELVESEEMKTTQKKNHYNIVATVDAISPIIAMDPSDPFALVELYDKDADENSCVLVLNGAQALACHSAILPGDTLVFHGLIRKPWPIPDIFKGKPSYQFLNARIPSWVFVATDSCCVSWLQSNNPGLSLFPPTPLPLVSIEGQIVHAKKVTLPKAKQAWVQTIHWLGIHRLEEDRSFHYKLFLTYFPIPPALQLSLRVGATIRAVNVHPIYHDSLKLHTNSTDPTLIFGACLRSTLTLVRAASEQVDKGLVNNYLQQDSSFSDEDDNVASIHIHTQSKTPTTQFNTESRTLSLTGLVPYSLSNIQRSYHEHIYCDHVADWLHKNFRKSSKSSSNGVKIIAKLPTVDYLVEYLRAGVQKEIDKPLQPTDCNAPNPNNHPQALGSKSKRRTKKTSSRNPYAEFFDHAGGDLLEIDAPGTEGLCGCRISREEQSSLFSPVFVGLNDIRMKCLHLLAERFSSLINSSGVTRGWTGSIELNRNELWTELRGQERGFSDSALYTGGYVSELTADRSTTASISDKNCQLPVSFAHCAVAELGDFIVGCVESVVISCLCIVAPEKRDIPGFINTHERTSNSAMAYVQETSLPPLNTASFNVGKGLMGCCALVRHDCHILVAAVQIRCDSPFPLGFASPAKVRLSFLNEDDQKETCSIEECLLPMGTSRDSLSFNSIKSILVRRRFRYTRIQSNGVSNCCIITLSNMPVERNSKLSDVICPQTIDLKIGIPCDVSTLISFKRSLASLLSTDICILEDQQALGACWWIIADSGKTCALVYGGWDELVNGSNAANTAVHVRFPLTALSIGGRGYARFACNSNELQASLHSYNSESTDGAIVRILPFDFVGGSKFIDGMLSQRPYRRRVFGSESPPRIIGELFYPPSNGVPSCTLSDLFLLVCKVLRDENPTIMSPSLVRRLTGAHFLGVSFCQVQCICNRCFKPLIDTSPKRKSEKNPKESKKDEPSFWHLPHDMNASRPVKNTTSNRQSHILKSKLRCPNKCPIEAYEVKWECSGILDDGTGQAKLYSERNAALTLLGMKAQVIEWIEEGIWCISNGTIRFNKSIPPTRELQECVRIASSQKRSKGDPLKCLTPAVRAEYLLQQHCRSSSRPRRKLDYLIRCKPLADNIKHLNHTMVEEFISDKRRGNVFSGEVATYSLPPLKLQLVDCCSTSYDQTSPFES